MKRIITIIALIAATIGGVHPVLAADPAPALPAASLENRIAALEAYIGNGDPSASLPKDTNGSLTITAPATVGVSGPGHNAWMMTSSALVLFMTLPGLFLFYRSEE